MPDWGIDLTKREGDGFRKTPLLTTTSKKKKPFFVDRFLNHNN